MTTTATASQTTTMTEARVRAVMQNVAANLRAFVVAGHAARERAVQWERDLTYLQVQGVLEFFEVQLNGRSFGLRYIIRSDGSIQQNSPSGGLDVYGLAAGTRVQIYAHLREDTPQRVYDELARRGWGTNGKRIDAAESDHRSYSSEGYGLVRAKLGTWP